MKNSSYVYGALTAALIGLTGCGSGSSSGESTSGTTSVITGKAIDGYLSGATVCLDLNSSFVCDPAEPTTTDANGTFVLEIGDYNASVLAESKLLVYGGIDIDTNQTFEGMLSAPFETDKDALIVTPLTTLVAAKVDSNGTIENAKEEVAASLGIKPEDFSKDPVAEANLTLMEMSLEYEKALELLAAAINEDENVTEAIAHVADVLSPYFDGRQTTLIDVLANLDLSDSGYDDATLARIEEAKLAIESITHRLDAHGVVTDAEIRAKIKKMGKDAEKYKDNAMKKIKDDDAEFSDSDLDDDPQETVETDGSDTDESLEADDGSPSSVDSNNSNPADDSNEKTKVDKPEKPEKPEKPNKKDDDSDTEDAPESEDSNTSV